MKVKIKLESDIILKTKIGSKIDFNEEWYQIKKFKYQTINYVKLLDIEHKDIFQYSNKFIGDEVKKGDLLAHKKSFLNTKSIISDYDGVLEKIDHFEGLLIIKTDYNDNILSRAYFKGVLVNFDKKSSVATIEIQADKNPIEIVESNSINNQGGEYVIIIEDNVFFTINELAIENKIIITDNINVNLATKISALGAKGIIYTNGDKPNNILSWKLKNQKDLEKIVKIKAKYVIISGLEHKIYFYS